MQKYMREIYIFTIMCLRTYMYLYYVHGKLRKQAQHFLVSTRRSHTKVGDYAKLYSNHVIFHETRSCCWPCLAIFVLIERSQSTVRRIHNNYRAIGWRTQCTLACSLNLRYLHTSVRVFFDAQTTSIYLRVTVGKWVSVWEVYELPWSLPYVAQLSNKFM